MIKPTEYKSIAFEEINARKGKEISQETKNECFSTLSKFVELFKLKHL